MAKMIGVFYYDFKKRKFVLLGTCRTREEAKDFPAGVAMATWLFPVEVSVKIPQKYLKRMEYLKKHELEPVNRRPKR